MFNARSDSTDASIARAPRSAGAPRSARRASVLLATAALTAGAVGLAAGPAQAIPAPTPTWATVATFAGLTTPVSAYVDSANHTMYVTEANSNDVAVYDMRTNTVTSRIPTGTYPLSLTYNPTNGQMYVGNRNSNTVTVIDKATLAVVATISTPQEPGFGIATEVGVNTVTNKLYIPVLGPGYDERLYVIDGATNTVTAQIPGSHGGEYGVAVDEATNTIYVASQNRNAIAVCDGATNAFLREISLGGSNHQPQSVRFNPVTKKLYTSNVLTNSVSVIDATTDAVLSEIPIGTGIGAPAIDPVTNTVFVPSYGTNSATVIDGATDTVTQTIPLGGEAFFSTWDPASSSVYIPAYSGTSLVTQISLGTAPVITSVSPGAGAQDTAYNFQVTASGTAPITFSISSGALPGGLTLDPATGVISGTATAAGSFSFVVTATNAWGSDSQETSIDVSAGVAPTIVSARPLAGTVGTPYEQTVSALGTRPITFAVTAGALPAGLTLNPTNGVISGTPTSSGSFSFTITATNNYGTDAQSTTLEIAAAVVPPTPTPTATPTPVPTSTSFPAEVTSSNLASTGAVVAVPLGVAGALLAAGLVFFTLRRRAARKV